MEKMKVIIIGPAHPYRGGIADTNHSLCRAFGEMGHDCEIITFKLQYPNFLFPGKNQFSEDSAPTDIKILRKINSINPLNWFSAASYIRKKSPDLVIIRYWLPYMAPALGTIARLIKQDTQLLALCDNVLPHEKRWGDKKLTQYFTKHISGFITLSEHVSQELQQFTKQQILTLFHPINTDLGSPIPKSLARKKLGLSEDGNYILFFGLVRAYKGLDLLLNSLANEGAKSANVKLIIAGEFYEDRKKYDDIILKYRLNDQVVIHDHFIAREDIPIYFCAADLLAQTYHTASQSGVTQIAYHFDLPLLVTNIGGLTEMVPHQRVGLVVSKDANNISTAISDFFRNNLGTTYAENIRVDKEKYTWKAFAHEVLQSFIS